MKFSFELVLIEHLKDREKLKLIKKNNKIKTINNTK